MNTWAKFVVLILFCSLTAACGADLTPMVTAIPNISNISTETLTPVLTKTPLPTPVIQVSSTHKPTPTIPPATMAVVATIEALITEKPELGKYYERHCITIGFCCCVGKLGLSPNGKWAVFFDTKNGTGGLNIVNVSSRKQWNIYYSDIIKGLQGDVWVNVEHWSHDGHYLYVSPYMSSSGGDGWFWRNHVRLIRMNLNNGTWVDTKMGSAFSFSPNDRYIAYRRGQNVLIHEFRTGEEQTFALPAEYVIVGRFLWSPDSKQIIFISSAVKELLADEAIGKPKGFSLFLLNLDDMSVQTILEKDERYLYPVEWQTPNLVLLEGLYTVSSDGMLESRGDKYLLDLQTNRISEYQSP